MNEHAPLATDHLIQEKAWRAIDADWTVPTMLSRYEQRLLYWLAKSTPLSPSGCIVDAGCFLGGSTVPLAQGMRDNEAVTDKAGRILVYDWFVAPTAQGALGLIGHSRKPGETYLDLFAENVGDLWPLICVTCGDFNGAPLPETPIDILFVDLAKTWSLNTRVVARLFPLLRPGSFLVQQDFNDHCCPWVKVTMEAYRDHFEHLADEVGGTRLYRLRSAIPAEALQRDLRPDALALMDAAIDREQRPTSRYMMRVSRAWLVEEEEGAEAAKRYLASIAEPQPWQSERPYREVVAAQLG